MTVGTRRLFAPCFSSLSVEVSMHPPLEIGGEWLAVDVGISQVSGWQIWAPFFQPKHIMKSYIQIWGWVKTIQNL